MAGYENEITNPSEDLPVPVVDAKANSPDHKLKQAGAADYDGFRDYGEENSRYQVVREHYRQMRINQTYDFVAKMECYWFKFDKAQWTIREAFEQLESYVDSSDPDIDLPNVEHAFQTAESIREAGHPDWFQLVGLLHDIGKIMFKFGTEENGQNGTGDGAQWALGGDTWVVGMPIPDSIVFSEFNSLNKDSSNPIFIEKNGIYKPGCGLDKLKFAFGHDEYMYRLLKHNNCSIPEEGLQMIRLHSCYVLHDKNEYQQLLAEEDHGTLEWVREFNKADLYTKKNKRPDMDALWKYYQPIIDKYCPGKLAF
mmetsp:Transcript_17687/g.21789  ORF Transcript_17687/g.21789 Transcript_17687/m.21789 type:complete len:310 (+) Transcript_17687:150-1079(+)|eukprot:CAMPEP_0204835308 /NCGR_PEP_ID=MMETSP1346-20131115/22229_1 /ASSEMBLY_ACC=CAM_ASM_000771 /TAXON_ID=215587 /ORGANISM="Aplanochytrium stocchinoi, Strain GSBS06" /LENGTH=309 /DNA_ID=CAMNT_0051969195 /DNA_START=147 /DNA_END=1076 /DNA_ORIENTATION=+